MPWITKAKLADIEGRLKDLERHFVTKRDSGGVPIETLADVPLEERKKRKKRVPELRAMSMQQRLQWLEKTDGGRRLPS